MYKSGHTAKTQLGDTLRGLLRSIAARKMLFHPDEVKKKISASQIINRLNKQANDEIEMSDKAIQASNILLKKLVPDLKAVDHSGELNVTGDFFLHLG